MAFEERDCVTRRWLRDSAPESVPQPPQAVTDCAATKFVPSGGSNGCRLSNRLASRNAKGGEIGGDLSEEKERSVLIDWM